MYWELLKMAFIKSLVLKRDLIGWVRDIGEISEPSTQYFCKPDTLKLEQFFLKLP